MVKNAKAIDDKNVQFQWRWGTGCVLVALFILGILAWDDAMYMAVGGKVSGPNRMNDMLETSEKAKTLKSSKNYPTPLPLVCLRREYGYVKPSSTPALRRVGKNKSTLRIPKFPVGIGTKFVPLEKLEPKNLLKVVPDWWIHLGTLQEEQRKFFSK